MTDQVCDLCFGTGVNNSCQLWPGRPCQCQTPSAPLQAIANAAALRTGQSSPAPMHENPALALAMQQLEDAAKFCDDEMKSSLTKRGEGYYKGRADAYHHVISVLSQTMV